MTTKKKSSKTTRKDPYAKAPRISDEFMYGERVRLHREDVIPAEKLAEDPRVDQELLAESLEHDDKGEESMSRESPRD